MSTAIKITSIDTNLKVFDAVKEINAKNNYRVVYLDLIKGKAVLDSIDYVNNTYILDLKDCDNFVII